MKKLHMILIVVLSLVLGSMFSVGFAGEITNVSSYEYEDAIELLNGVSGNSASITKGIVFGQKIGVTTLKEVYSNLGIPADGITNASVKSAVYSYEGMEVYFYFNDVEVLSAVWIRKNEMKKEEVAKGTVFGGLVTDAGGINDKSFNSKSWSGFLNYISSNNIDKSKIAYIESKDHGDYLKNLTFFASRETDLIVAPGFLMVEPVASLCDTYPDQKILVLDAIVDRPNVLSAVFAEEEGSYLVGIAAALKAKELKSNKVGFVGGMDFPLIRKFEAGFVAGVHGVDPNIEVEIAYSESFSDVQVGEKIANVMYGDGVSVIYHAAGAVGFGLIDSAKEMALNGKEVYVIGVDIDSYDYGIYKDGKSVILTSMVKNLDQVVFDTLEKVENNSFTGGIAVYGVASNGVGLPSVNPNLREENIKTIEAYKKKIISGEIKVPAVPSRVQY